MEHQTLLHDGILTIRMSEALTFDDHRVFRDLLKEIATSGSKRCVLDFAELESIDSAGLGMLMIAFEASEREQWELVISRPHGHVKRMLEVTEFDKLLTIER